MSVGNLLGGLAPTEIRLQCDLFCNSKISRSEKILLQTYIHTYDIAD